MSEFTLRDKLIIAGFGCAFLVAMYVVIHFVVKFW